MKRFKINLESFHQAPKPGLTYCGEGLFDLFKKKKDSKPSSSTQSSNNSVDKKNEEPKIEDFEEALKTATGFSVHLDCDTIQNQIKFLEAYKSKFIPFLYKDIERLSKCFEFIKTKKRTFIDHIDELVDISFPDKMPGYNASKNACVFPEFIIPIGTTKEKLTTAKTNIEFDDRLYDYYPNITDKAEQEKILKLHTFNTWIYQFSHCDIVHKRSKEQDKITLSLDDSLAKKYIELSLEICKEMKKISEAMDSLRNIARSTEDSLDIEEDAGGDGIAVRTIFAHGLIMMKESRYFEHRFLRNCKLSKTDIATEAMTIAQEGKIEQIKSFFERTITTKNSMKKAIASLQGKEVKEVFEQEDGGKFSGLKLLDVDKVDGKAIIKYLELVKREKDQGVDFIRKVFDQTQKSNELLLKSNSGHSVDEIEADLSKIEETLVKYTEDFKSEFKQHEKVSSNRKTIQVSSANKVEFDKIISLFMQLCDVSYLKELESIEIKTWGFYNNAEEAEWLENYRTLGLTIDLIMEANNYLKQFEQFEEKFLFSLMKYLQVSVK